MARETLVPLSLYLEIRFKKKLAYLYPTFRGLRIVHARLLQFLLCEEQMVPQVRKNFLILIRTVGLGLGLGLG